MAELGTIIDNTYQLTAYINCGGMSAVYEAVNIRVGNRWAIKEILKTGDYDNQMYIDALIREANMMKDLDYPAFPRIVDIVENDQALYLVMDYIEGRTLSEIFKQEGPQPEGRVIGWAIQLCDALAYLHNRPSPIIYRDMKPSNVIVKRDGSLRIIDFGTARVYNPEKANDTVPLGTKGFAPPEQYVGQTDERSDIYALGATMRALLTGFNPRSNENVNYHAVYADLGLSAKMVHILDKCTALNPDERYQSCEELRAALLDEDEDRRPPKKKPWLIILIAVIALILIGAGVFAFLYFNGTLTGSTAATETVVQKVKVPNVVGMTYDEAKAALEKLGLKCEKVEEQSDTVDKDVVISQDKKADEKVDKGTTVKLTVSLGEKATEAEESEEEATDAEESSSSYSSSSSSSYSDDDDSSDSYVSSDPGPDTSSSNGGSDSSPVSDGGGDGGADPGEGGGESGGGDAGGGDAGGEDPYIDYPE